MDTQNENIHPSPVIGIKDKYLEQLQSDFQLLSEIVLMQTMLASRLVHDNHNEELVEQLKPQRKDHRFTGYYY